MTLSVLLIFLFMFVTGLTIFVIVWHAIGFWTGIASGSLAGYWAGLGLCKILDHVNRIKTQKRRNEMHVEYNRIFQVLALPTDEKKGIFKLIMSKEPEIRAGDYGWEIKPLKNSDLIYLQGLDQNWRAIWLAGFRRDQIEYIGPKPVSLKPKTPCPFPVQSREKLTPA
jgi:hypothetical protein